MILLLLFSAKRSLSVEVEENENEVVQQIEQTITKAKETVTSVVSSGDRFYSPLVKNIAKARRYISGKNWMVLQEQEKMDVLLKTIF